MTRKFDGVDGKYSGRTAVYAGSFNPFTIGHDSIVRRAVPLFDTLVIAVGINISKSVDNSSADKIVSSIAQLYADDKRIKVVAYDTLTGQLCKQIGAEWLVRGVRSAIDFENERTLADANREIYGIETILIPALPEMGYVSSSLVRELEKFGADASALIPSKR